MSRCPSPQNYLLASLQVKYKEVEYVDIPLVKEFLIFSSH